MNLRSQLLHVLHSDWNVGALVVYAACAGVVLASAGLPHAVGAAA